MAVGAAWTIVTRIGVRVVGIISTLILARLLVPEDFGLLSMALVFIGLLEATSQFGFDVALIRDQQADRATYDTVWTLGVLRGVAMAALLAGTSGLVAEFFGEPRLQVVLLGLAMVPLLQGLNNVGVVDFRKELDGFRDFLFLMGGKLAGFSTVVPLAFVLGDYRALVVGSIAGEAVTLALSYRMHPHRPRPCLVRWRELVDFSKWMFVHNLIVAVGEKADSFAISKLYGSRELGLYTLAFEIANTATSLLIAPVRRMIFPGFAKLKHDRPALARNYVETFALVATIAVPTAAGIGLTAAYMVPLLLGPAWIETVPLIQVLSLAGVVRGVAASSGSVLLALGQPRSLGLYSGINVAVLLPLLAWGVAAAGALGAAWAICASSLLLLLLYLGADLRLLDLSPGRLVVAVWRVPAASGAMAAVLLSLQANWPPAPAPVVLLLQLSATVVLGAVVCAATQLLLWGLAGRPDGAERRVVETLRGFSVFRRPALRRPPG